MDWGFIGSHIADYAAGAWVTLRFGLYGVGCSLVLGLLCCLARYFRVPVLKSIAHGYIELARNTPLLVQLFFLYAGLPRVGIKLSAEACAVIGLTFLGGAYMSEAFRSGLESVEKSQREAGECLGLNWDSVSLDASIPYLHIWQQHTDKDGLHNVGDKYKGTWSYANGKITFKATEWSASYFISSLSPLEYTFYSYDVNTMEASPWYGSSFADTLEDAVWTVSLKSGKLQAKINMDTFVLQKKN